MNTHKCCLLSLAMDDSEGDFNLQGLLKGVVVGSHSN